MTVRDDARLVAGHGDGFHPKVLDRHTEECNGDLLPRGEEHIQFTRIRIGAHFTCQGDQPVGISRTGGKHHDEFVSGVLARHHPARHRLDPLNVGDRSATILLNHKCHTNATSLVFESQPPDFPLSYRIPANHAQRDNGAGEQIEIRIHLT